MPNSLSFLPTSKHPLSFLEWWLPYDNEFSSENAPNLFFPMIPPAASHSVFVFFFYSFLSGNTPKEEDISHNLITSLLETWGVFIKTCNNVDCSVHCFLLRKPFKENLQSGKEQNLLMPLTSFSWTTENRRYHGAIYPPAHSGAPQEGHRRDMAPLQEQFHFPQKQRRERSCL